MSKRFNSFVIAGAIAAAVVPSLASAASIIGLIDGKTLVMIDPASRKVTEKVDVKGASAALIGIDVRPADGMLYGVTADGNVVTIDPKSGQATQKSKLSEALKSGVAATVDFNPVADRMRIMGSDGTSGVRHG